MLAHFSDDSRAFLLRAVSYCYPLKQIFNRPARKLENRASMHSRLCTFGKTTLTNKMPGFELHKLKIINSFASEMEVTCRYFTRNFIFIYEPSVDTGWK